MLVAITPSTDGGQSVHSAVGHCAVRPPGRRWRSTIRAGEMTDLIAQMENHRTERKAAGARRLCARSCGFSRPAVWSVISIAASSVCHDEVCKVRAYVRSANKIRIHYVSERYLLRIIFGHEEANVDWGVHE